MTKLIFLKNFIAPFLVSIFSLIFATNAASAQTQSTYGNCSPAMKDIKGDVKITCILPNNRIRIAKYNTYISEDLTQEEYLELAEFIDENEGKVVRLDLKMDSTIDIEILNQDPSNEASAYLSLKSKCAPEEIEEDKECESSGGIMYEFVSKDKNFPALSYANGQLYIRGYFVPEMNPGMHQGWVSNTLVYVDTNQVIFSDKFSTD